LHRFATVAECDKRILLSRLETRSLYIVWAWIGIETWRTERRTNRRTPKQDYDS